MPKPTTYTLNDILRALRDTLSRIESAAIHIGPDGPVLQVSYVDTPVEPAPSSAAQDPATPSEKPARGRKSPAPQAIPPVSTPPADTASATSTDLFITEGPLMSSPDLTFKVEKIGGIFIARTKDTDGIEVVGSDIKAAEAVLKLDAEVLNKRRTASPPPPADAELEAQIFDRPALPADANPKVVEALRNVEGNLPECIRYARRILSANAAKGVTVPEDKVRLLARTVAHFGWSPTPGTEADYYEHVLRELTQPATNTAATLSEAVQGTVAPAPDFPDVVDDCVYKEMRAASEINLATWDFDLGVWAVCKHDSKHDILVVAAPEAGIDVREVTKGLDTAGLIALRDRTVAKYVGVKRAALGSKQIIRQEGKTPKLEQYRILVAKPADQAAVVAAQHTSLPIAASPSASRLPDGRLKCGNIEFSAATSQRVWSCATNAELIWSVTTAPEMAGRLPEVPVVVAAIMGSNLFPPGSKLNNPSVASESGRAKIAEFAQRVSAEASAKT